MHQASFYGYFNCGEDKARCFSEAITVIADDFAYDDENDHEFDVVVSDDFRSHFPATRSGRVLSGLWDRFDAQGVGYGGKEYLEPNGKTRVTPFGAVFHSDRGHVEPVISIIEKLREGAESATLWWSDVDDDPAAARSGTVVIGPDGTCRWTVDEMRDQIAEGRDSASEALARLLEDRRQLLASIDHLTPKCRGEAIGWEGVI